jgi:hypothetical protein|tara:strand:- start:238 stop:393 length:156 start_codon:yes stop_codon:yes gene_type:complete
VCYRRKVPSSIVSSRKIRNTTKLSVPITTKATKNKNKREKDGCSTFGHEAV